MSPMYLRPALASFLIVTFGLGTSFAAADALPGDLLYPVKTSVNERITAALAVTDQQKATVSAKFVVRRLEEAETLASQGRLSRDVQAQIEMNFDQHAQDFETHTAALAREEGREEDAADAQSDLETSLKVHAAILADLSEAVPETGTQASAIAQKVDERARDVEASRVALEKTIARKVGDDIRVAAAARQRIAEKEISRIQPRPSVAAKAMSLSAIVADESATTTEEDQDAETELQQGSERFDAGQYGEAFTKFQGAIRAAQRARLDSDVRGRLNIGVIPVESRDSDETESNPSDQSEGVIPVAQPDDL